MAIHFRFFTRHTALTSSAALSLLLAVPSLARAQTAPETAHCLMLPLSPERRAQQSALVVEAEVRDAQSFWDASHQHLFTRHRLRVFSLLKGSVADTTGLTVITEGGRLGLDQQTLTNTLSLRPGQQGLLFLYRAPWPGLPAGSTTWAAYGSEQGFIKYDVADGTAAEPFRTYPTIDANFYTAQTRLTGQTRRVLQTNSALAAAEISRATAARGQAPIIASLQPTQLAAGVGAVLIIRGSGFGATQGTGFVEFRNADDGGATRTRARDTDYISWTDSEIRLQVPSSTPDGHPAGSGTVRVTANGILTTESTQTLTVVYALTNVVSTVGEIVQRPNHVALDNTGNFSFRFGPNFTANTAANTAWQNALGNWRCQTGMNWQVAEPATANTIAEDGQNIIAFDQGSQLPDRILGRTTSYYGGCYNARGEVIFWVKEVDMQFDDATNWQFGPALPTTAQIDFETVAVHELGHAQQLTHLILPGAIMHYAVRLGQNARVLNTTSDVAGGRLVLRSRSFRYQGCGGPALLPAPLTGLTANGGTVSWTTRNECFLSNFVVERTLALDTTAAAWTRLATMPAGQTSGQYQATDAQSPAGLHYYRLGLVRPGGSIDYAAPLLATGGSATAGAIIFPNPLAGNELSLQYPASSTATLAFNVFDEAGRLHQTTVSNVQNGLNVLTLNVGSLPPGFYLLSWKDEQGTRRSRKFVRL